jgi:hypothetical protein
MPEIAKVIFDLEVDEDGFPPISGETLNVIVEPNGLVLDNTPFFVTEIALGDRVEADPIPGVPGKYTFVRVLEQSGYKAISIIFLSEDVKQPLLDDLRALGCYCEYGEFNGGAMQMLAVAVPAACDYDQLAARLAAMEAADELSYAELAL